LEPPAPTGTEAGGHGPSHDLGQPLDDLLASVSPHYPPSTPPFLLAAGGLSSSSSISSVLSKFPSVSGVVTGTAFTVSTESLWSNPQKELVIRTKSGEETDRGLEWDQVRNAMGWPAGVDGRAIRNKTRGRKDTVVEESKRGEGPNLDEVGTWAGSFLVSLFLRSMITTVGSASSSTHALLSVSQVLVSEMSIRSNPLPKFSKISFLNCSLLQLLSNSHVVEIAKKLPLPPSLPSLPLLFFFRSHVTSTRLVFCSKNPNFLSDFLHLAITSLNTTQL